MISRMKSSGAVPAGASGFEVSMRKPQLYPVAQLDRSRAPGGRKAEHHHVHCADVTSYSGARYPARLRLEGRHTSLEPLDPTAHADALFEATSGSGNDDLWLYLAD